MPLMFRKKDEKTNNIKSKEMQLTCVRVDESSCKY